MITDAGIYKFSSGPMKDQPLDQKGLTWEIATIGGRTVAAFSDGTYTDFYVSIPPRPGPDWNRLQKKILENKFAAEQVETKPIAMAESMERGARILEPKIESSTEYVPGISDVAQTLLISSGTTRPSDPENDSIRKPAIRFRKELPPGFYDKASKVEYGRSTIICRFKTIIGSNPTHSGEPVFGIYSNENRVLVCTYDRATVGKGVREFLWLYQKLREYDRGRLAAFREAWQVYFL